MISSTGCVLSAEDLGVLLPRREHDLVTSDVLGDGIFGELDRVVVQEFGLGSGGSPCGGNSVDVRSSRRRPSRSPSWGRAMVISSSGLLVLACPGQSGIGAVVELADQFHRAVEGMEAAIAVVADVHHPSTGRTVAVEDVEFPEGEIGIRRPVVSHPADLHAMTRSVD